METLYSFVKLTRALQASEAPEPCWPSEEARLGGHHHDCYHLLLRGGCPKTNLTCTEVEAGPEGADTPLWLHGGAFVERL